MGPHQDYEIEQFSAAAASRAGRGVDNVVKSMTLHNVFAISALCGSAKGLAAARGTSATAFWLSAISASLVGITAGRQFNAFGLSR